MKTVTNPATGQVCYFDEVNHKYFVGDTVLTSVTQFVSSFFPKFDAEKQAPLYAKKHNLKVEDVLEKWESKAAAALVLGKTVHGYAESGVKNEPYHMDHSPSQREHGCMAAIDMALAQMRGKFEILGAEVMVWSVVLGLAGQIDLICQDKHNRDMVIFDWKTSEQIEMENFFQNGLGPLEGFMDCNFNHYQFQLNTYQVILEKEKFFYPEVKNYRRGIIHLKDHDVAWFKVGDLRPVVRAMINWI